MKMKILKSKPLSQKKILSFIDSEMQAMRTVAERLSDKLGDGGKRCVFKTLAPTSADGQMIANIRDNLAHIRCCINSIACGTGNKSVLDEK